LEDGTGADDWQTEDDQQEKGKQAISPC
jgi:hypothetical protein